MFAARYIQGLFLSLLFSLSFFSSFSPNFYYIGYLLTEHKGYLVSLVEVKMHVFPFMTVLFLVAIMLEIH